MMSLVTSAHAWSSLCPIFATNEEEYTRNKENITNPWLVMTDYSWPINLVCMSEFCNSSLQEYLNRHFCIIMGKANKERFRENHNSHMRGTYHEYQSQRM